MKLVDASHITEQEQQMQQALANYPELRERLMYLFRGYREQLQMQIDDMYQSNLDSGDMQRSMAKRDSALRMLGLLTDG